MYVCDEYMADYPVWEFMFRAKTKMHVEQEGTRG